MAKFFRIFLWGAMISFLGSLPLGTLNVLAMQIGIDESIEKAMLFSFGSLLVEMIYVRVSLIGIDWIRKQHRIMRIMEWITLGIVVALAVGSFISAVHTNGASGGDNHSWLRNLKINRFLLGMLGCAINPVVIVFWFGWSTVLFTKKILEPNNTQYNSYIVGIGLGTLAGNCVFIFGGKYLYEKISGAQQYMHWFIGGVFALTALIQLYKILSHKDALSKFEEKTTDHRPPMRCEGGEFF